MTVLQTKKQSGLAILLGDEYTNESPTSNFESDPVLQEVDIYLKEKPLNREESLLVWWRDNSHRFPLLSCIARKYLTIPATSTPAERVFSIAGLTVTKLRSCLSPEHVNMSVYLNKNCLSWAILYCCIFVSLLCLKLFHFVTYCATFTVFVWLKIKNIIVTSVNLLLESSMNNSLWCLDS